MTEARSPWRAVWRGFNRHKGARLGLIVLAALILFVLIGPALRAAPDMTVAQQIRLRNLPGDLPSPPSFRTATAAKGGLMAATRAASTRFR